MKNLKKRWKTYGIVYFTAVFMLVPSLASAYIDPSVTTYAIQAIVGVAVAAGAFFATYGRRMKKSWMRTLGIDENETRTTEAPLEITREDLKEELRRKREEREKQAVPAAKKNTRGRIITSLLCGFAPALVLILRPVLSFYLSNEGEFWFSLSDVMPDILLVFFAFALTAAAVHFLLPDGRKAGLRLWFGTAAAAGTLCAFVQDHFLSSYLPALTGEEIDWSAYGSWNGISLALWGGVFLLFLVLVIVRPRFMKGTVYALLLFVLCAETAAGAVDVLSARHANRRPGTYFTQNGMYETSEAGNVVVLVSDTFEGTYLNQILESSPEYKDLLPDITYYDNVSGISVFTHFSYPKLLTGEDFPLGSTFTEGVTRAFEHETLIDRIYSKGWEIGYFTEFTPTPNVKDKLINYADEELRPNRTARIQLTKLLLRGALFRSVPQMLKQRFAVTTLEFEYVKYELENVAPYMTNDVLYYEHLRESGLNRADGRPRYTVTELFGVHEPCTLGADFSPLENAGGLSMRERQLETGRAQLKLLRTYLDRLKDAGTYDRTTVIMIADHGRENRFYPVCLVKEANRTEDGFRVDHTPLSLQEDYPNLIDALTSGESFSGFAAQYADSGRVRTGLDFRAPSFGERTFSGSVVEIPGDASDAESFRIARDEFVRDDTFAGRYTPGEAIVSGGKAGGSTAAVYGIEDGIIPGHSVVFDVFFETEEPRKLTLDGTFRNITGQPQRIVFSLNGETFRTITLDSGTGDAEMDIPLPEVNTGRMTLEMDFPDAVKQDNIGWSTYSSVSIPDASIRK